MATKLPLKSYSHSHDYCPYNHTHSNPAHSMERFLEKTTKYGMPCNNPTCEKEPCKALTEEFSLPIIYCTSKRCAQRGCRYLRSLSLHKVRLSMCYEITTAKITRETVCKACKDIKKTEQNIEINMKKIGKQERR